MAGENRSDIGQSPFATPEDHNPVKCLEVYLSHEEDFRHTNVPASMVKFLQKRSDVEYLKIISTDNYAEPLSEESSRNEIDEMYYLLEFKNKIVSTFKKLRTLYLETFAWTSLIYVDKKYMEELPFLEKVTIVNRMNREEREVVDFRLRQVEGERKIDYIGKNLSSTVWGFAVPIKIEKMSTEELYLKTCIGACYSFELSGALRYLKSFDLTGFVITEANFVSICTHSTELEKFVVHIGGCISLNQFSNVRNLKNLRTLRVKMDYDFSREDLILLFGNSEASNLYVEILECKSKGDLIAIELKGIYIVFIRW